MTSTWRVVETDNQFWLALYNDEHGVEVREHPIPFDRERDAERAAARLNARENR